MWIDPCSWVGKNVRDTGCILDYGDSQSSVAFLNEGDRWLVSIEQFLVSEQLNAENLERVPLEHKSNIERFLLSHDQSTVAVTTKEGDGVARELVVWDLVSETAVWRKTLADDNRLGEISPDGLLVVLSAETDREIWSVADGERIATFDDVWGIAFAPHGRSFAVTSDKGVQLYLTESLSSDEPLFIDALQVNIESDLACPTYSPDGRLFAIGDTQLLHVLDVETGATLFELPQSPRFHYCAFSFSADSSTLVVSSFTPQDADAAVDLYDLATGERTNRIDVKFTFPLQVALSPKGDQLAVGGSDIVYLIDLDSAE